jgi:hypothetical protein
MENALNVTPHQHGTVIRISCSVIPEIVDCDEALDLFCSPVFQLSRTLILFFILVKVEEYKRTYGQNNRGGSIPIGSVHVRCLCASNCRNRTRFNRRPDNQSPSGAEISITQSQSRPKFN